MNPFLSRLALRLLALGLLPSIGLGTPEAGKRADFVIVDRDLLGWPVDNIKDARVLETWVDGKQVYRSE
jgi:predicted amidohydrolase YtcJ